MFPVQVAGVATAAVTLGVIAYSQTNFFVPPPPYLDAIIRQGVSVEKFDEIYEKLSAVSCRKGVGDKEEVASILFREDDPLRSWQTRYYALKSAIEVHPSFFFVARYEKLLKNKNILLKNKNILIIKQGNTETKSFYDFSDAVEEVRQSVRHVQKHYRSGSLEHR